MSKQSCLLISFVAALLLASAGYADIKVDFDATDDVNAGGDSTEAGWTSFVLEDTGSEVNGIIIDIDVSTASSARRPDPNSETSMLYLGEPVNEEQVHRDFIYGLSDNPVEITLWGLGAGQKCDIHIWAFDDSSETRRVANWTANGAELLTTDFVGGDYFLWPVDTYDIEHYDFNGIAYADDVGRIVLTSTEDPNNDGVPFAFANGLEVITYGTPNSVPKTHRPVPFDAAENVSIDSTLSWIPGDGATSHRVYMGTDPCSLTLVGTVATPSYTPLDFLAMGTVYYWRVDEMPGPVTGDVWTFETSDNYVVDDFQAYSTENPIYDYWDDYTINGTSAEIYTESSPAYDGQSMRVRFLNGRYDPHYSETTLDLDQSGIEVDPNFVGMGAASLSMLFFGDVNNTGTEPMYAILSDGAATAHVTYSGDMNDVIEEEWHEWNISMQAFLDANSSLDLTNIQTVGIGFAEGTPADGNVYFDNIRLYSSRCVLVERSSVLARADFAPLPNADCVVDNVELAMISRDWLSEDQVVETKNPNDVNLVLYYPLNEGDGNVVYPAVSPNDPCWTGIFWNSELDPPSDVGTVWVKDGVPGIGDGNCVYMTGERGGGIRCGTLTNAGIGISKAQGDTEEMTLSLWVKWLGPRYWDAYLLGKGQGLMGKRGDYTETGMIWTFWISFNPGEEGGIGMGNHDSRIPDLVSPIGTMDPFIGEWTHIAATYNGDDDPNSTDAAKIYVGGFEVRRGPFALSLGDDPNLKLTIGQTTNAVAWPDGPSSFWGYMDEIRIYNRALEPNEVAYLADTTPEDGLLQIPIPSPAELYEQEAVGGRVVNFRDFAILADQWLRKEYWP